MKLDTKYVDVLTSTVDTNASTTTAITPVPIKCRRSVGTLSAVSTTSQSEESGDRTLEKITFPGKGQKPQILYGLGLAVSADYEIFVTDYTVKKVHVFSINGTHLRTFPTVLPGDNGTVYIQPSGVAIAVQPGYLWVVGQKNGNAYKGYIYVVRYSRNGRPVKVFKVRVVEAWFHAVIAVDVCNNKSSFNTTEQVAIGGITSGSEGNILITLTNAKTVMVYNHSGDKLFEFGSNGTRDTNRREFTGICLDTLGRIIVVNHKDERIDMFASRGKFVRTIAHIKTPWGIAMGPGGELVGSHTRFSKGSECGSPGIQ
ncbi:hypothetical protein Bbelb_079500 [Branchiostoma belcheri]|nr:hypothetical protein Bbelb_079500 [Branchiostoma belcheri]